MRKFASRVLLVLGLLLLLTSAASADVTEFSADGKVLKQAVPNSLIGGAGLGAGIGIAITLLGAGLGFGRIGGSALESMARQPEKAGQIQGAMITVAALLEGATFFALLVCLLLVLRVTF
jgi:F-type H+-transporting ATPase subunit c